MEPLVLQKGQRIDLTKNTPGVSEVKFALGWDEGKNLDPDASMIVLHNSRPFQNPHDLLFYNSNVKEYGTDGKPVWVDATKPYPFIMDGVLRSSGDNRDGAGDGDDETITVELTKLAADVSHLVPVITIYDHEARGQNFGQMNNCYCRVELPGTTFTPQKADLTEDASTDTAFIPGYFYRKDGEWKYNSIQKGIDKNTKGVDGKPIGSVDLTTIATNLTAILEIAVPA